MKMRPALLIVGSCTVLLSLFNLGTSALQERVSTCETQLNARQLEVINTLQRISSNEVKVVASALAIQIERATGIPGPVDPQLDRTFRDMQEMNHSMLKGLEETQGLIKAGCETQRLEWFTVSVVAILFSAITTCLAFWLGLKVVSNEDPVPEKEQIE